MPMFAPSSRDHGRRSPLLAALALTLAAAASAQDRPLGEVDQSDGQRRSIGVWAEPGLTRSPVAFTISPDGRLWVAESDRAGNAVTDTRQLGHLDAVWADGQLRTVEDRRRQIESWIAGGHFAADFFTCTEDRVRMVADTDGDGMADAASVFAGGFNDALDGIGAGVLWVGRDLLYPSIPHLWRLRDIDGDGRIDADPGAGERASLSAGYGVRWCFYGHDLHGLVHGPDGRVWFSMGDRGFDLQTIEGERITGTDRGGVFRCWPDGTGLELVHEGLRNPQELAFDRFGNLFTGDNNCDSGDRARVSLVLDGADSGWRQDVQSLPSRGPWNREAMWHLIESPADLTDPERPAWLLPPIAHVGAGPSGFAMEPGTTEAGVHAGRMLLVDFYGSGATIHSFDMQPRGAGFELVDRRDFYRGATITDLAFGPDGRLYLSDWGGGWSPNANGRVLVVTNESVRSDPERRAVIDAARAILAADPAADRTAALLEHLGHPDQRVRHRAQMELAVRGGWRPTAERPGETAEVPPAIRSGLHRIASGPDGGIGAIHAVWALGQIARRDPESRRRLLEFTSHPDAEVRTQVFRTIGDLRLPAGDLLAEALGDPHPPVRAAAAAAIGRSAAADISGGPAATAQRLLDLASREADADPVMRHAIATALARAVPAEVLREAEADSLTRVSEAARVVLAVALRQQAVIRVGEDVPAEGPRYHSRRIAGDTLADMLEDPAAPVRVRAEAARAIYDLHLGAAEPFTPGGPASAAPADAPFARLARVLDAIDGREMAIEPIVRRAVEANLRQGTPEAADRLMRFAARESVPAAWRILALERLEAWSGGDRRERVWGHWIPRPTRPTDAVEAALTRHESDLLEASSGDSELRFRVDRIRARLRLNLSDEEVRRTIADPARDPRFRAVLLAEAARRSPDAAAGFVTVARGLAGPECDLVRMAAVDLLADGPGTAADPERLLAAIDIALAFGTVRERQHAAERLGALAAAVDGPVAGPAAELLGSTLSAEPGDARVDPMRLELARATASVPGNDALAAAAAAIDAPWSGRRPEGFADAVLASGGDPLRGEAIFRGHEAAQCLRCHEIRGTGGTAGPRLTDVGARLSIEAIIESIIEPGRTITPGYGTVAAMPEMTGILSPAEVRDVVAYLASLNDPRSIRPEGAMIRPVPVAIGITLHVAAVVLAVGLAAAAALIRGGRGGG